MNDIAIRVEDLGKLYRLGSQKKSYKTLRDVLTNSAAAAWDRVRSGFSDPETDDKDDMIWALKDVSFQINRGEVVGIIGRNGAGKSTLLKILSRITDPTEGRAEIHGRVGSLLEVGTGFHPELSGRENIYLNGAILGMKRAEIHAKFDEIVAFAEVARFIDTPVKHYSSGMHMRLAFAVAAHLEPEILLVDEVLAVGDAAFQKKCLSKMGDVAKEGRTVLFVSHNMASVLRLCPKALLLEAGRVSLTGNSSEVVRAYLSNGSDKTAAGSLRVFDPAPGDAEVRMNSIRVRNASGEASAMYDCREPIAVEVEYTVTLKAKFLIPTIHLNNDEGTRIFTAGDFAPADAAPQVPGRYRATVWIPGNMLNEGFHTVNASISSLSPWHNHAFERDVVSFYVNDSIYERSPTRGDYSGRLVGIIRPALKWEQVRIEPAETLEDAIA